MILFAGVLRDIVEFNKVMKNWAKKLQVQQKISN